MRGIRNFAAYHPSDEAVNILYRKDLSSPMLGFGAGAESPRHPMRIAVDARELAGRPTGVGRYLAELLTQMGRRSPAAQRHTSGVS